MSDNAHDSPVYITTEKMNEGVRFVMDFYPAEWGGKRGIYKSEATVLVKGLLSALGMGVSDPSRETSS